MLKLSFLCFFLTAAALAQDPFVPLKLEALAAPTADSARTTWVRMTNQRLEMSGKTLRVAQEDEGRTAVFLAKGIEKARHAKPLLQGKGEHQLLFRSVVATGFSRILVRNPDTGQSWGARLEQGKPILD